MVLKCLIKGALCDFILTRYCYTFQELEVEGLSPTPSPTSLAFSRLLLGTTGVWSGPQSSHAWAEGTWQVIPESFGGFDPPKHHGVHLPSPAEWL